MFKAREGGNSKHVRGDSRDGPKSRNKHVVGDIWKPINRQTK